MKSLIKSLNTKFIDIADWVSWFIGTPLNVFLWTIIIGFWLGFWILNPISAAGDPSALSWLPPWVWEPVVQLPLNGLTTLAELYIGFLIAAAANRFEKKNKELHLKMLSIEETNEKILLHLTQILENTSKDAV